MKWKEAKTVLPFVCQEKLITTLLELSATLDVIEKGLFDKYKSRFKFSLLPYFIPPETLPDAWQQQPDTQLYCPIADKEYKNLKAWEHWQEHQAMNGRYTYIFGTVSLGTGFTVRVKDEVTDNLISVTNFEDW